MQYFKNLLAMMRKPFFEEVPMFDSDTDLSFIPSGGTNLVTESPTESPNGSRVAFTFSTAPKYISVDGVWYMPVTDYTVAGAVATLNFAPASGAILRGVV